MSIYWKLSKCIVHMFVWTLSCFNNKLQSSFYVCVCCNKATLLILCSSILDISTRPLSHCEELYHQHEDQPAINHPFSVNLLFQLFQSFSNYTEPTNAFSCLLQPFTCYVVVDAFSWEYDNVVQWKNIRFNSLFLFHHYYTFHIYNQMSSQISAVCNLVS